MNKHSFAFFMDDLSVALCDNQLVISEADLVHRLNHVVRISSGDTCTFFDAQNHCVCKIDEMGKKRIVCSVLACKKNEPCLPSVHWLLPLLERDAFEQSISLLAGMGATTIQPIATQKTKKKKLTEAEYKRCTRIIYSAAEQSKEFAMPTVCEVCALPSVLEDIPADAQKVFFDVGGDDAFLCMQDLRKKNPEDIFCLVGPEGDLTPEEKNFLVQQGWTVCSLTPTVLRAWQAVAVGMGIVRSCVRSNEMA